MKRAVSASVQPQCHAVGAAGLIRSALRRRFLAADRNLQGDAAGIPCQPYVGEVGQSVGGSEIVDATGFWQIEQRIRVVVRSQVHVPAGVREAKQEAWGDKRHAWKPLKQNGPPGSSGGPATVICNPPTGRRPT